MFFRFFHFSREGLASCSLLLLLAACFSAGPVAAQSDAGFPNKTVRLIVTFPPGGSADLVGRAVAKGLQDIWGQAVVVENRPGASGLIGAEIVARAAPDGTTLFMGTQGPIVVMPFLRDKMPYDALTDLTPIAMTGATPNVLVVGSQSPYKTFKDFIAAAKARPGALDYASSGRGDSHHMAMEHMMKVTGVKLNDIPYKGGAPAVLAVLSGEVQATWIAVSTALPHIRSGKLIGLAVSTLERRPQIPDIPTVAEQGFPGYDYSFWSGVVGPGKMSAALVKKIETDVKAVVTSASYLEQMEKLGNRPRFEPADQFSKIIREESARNKATLSP